MLCEAIVIKVDGLQGLDEFHEDEQGNTATLCEQLLKVGTNLEGQHQ